MVSFAHLSQTTSDLFAWDDGRYFSAFCQPSFLIFLRILRISISILFISFERFANNGIVSVAALLKEVCDALNAGGTRIPNHFSESDTEGFDSLSIECSVESSSTTVFFASGFLLTG